MALPVSITGPSPTNGIAGPFKSAAGNFYIIGRTTSGNQIRPYKSLGSAGNDGAWNAVSVVTIVPNCGTGTTGNLDAVQIGDVLHIATCLPDSTTATSTRIHYHKFDMASDTWTLTNEAVDGPTAASATTGGDFRSVCIIRRSASVVIAYQMPFVVSMSANWARVGYRERTDAGGTWSAAVALDALATAQTSAIHIGAVKDPQSDRIHFHWIEGTASPVALRTRTLSAANALNTASTLSISVSPQTATHVNCMRGTGYVSGGTSKIVITRQSATTALTGVYFDSADNPTVSTSSGTLPALPDIALATRVFSDDAKAYFLYVESVSTDVFLGQSTNHGATWSGFTLAMSTGAISRPSFSTNAGQVYVRGSSYVIPYVVNDAGTLKYNEYIVRAAAAPAINITTGTQTTLATTQSAAADVDLQASAAQTTLATTQAGTISAQAALAVTGAQNTSAATSSATADVDLALTGAQTTNSTTQAGTISAAISLNVSAAQTTLATTQSATVSAAVRNVTAAQATLATTQTAAATLRVTLTGAQNTLAVTQAAAADVDLAVTGAQATLATTQTGTVALALTVTGAQTTSGATQTATASVSLAVSAAQTTSATTQSALVLVTDSRLIVGDQTTNATTSTGSISIAALSKTWVKHGGVWKEAAVYAKHAGTWKAATVHVKQAGTWKRA